MSRYPFMKCVNEVLPNYIGNRADSTIEVMQRLYNRMDKEIKELFQNKQISTMSPRSFTPDDLMAYYNYLKVKEGIDGKPIKLVSLKKDFIDLDKLCKYYGNNCVDTFRARCPAMSARRPRRRLPSLSLDECKTIIEVAEKVSNDNFTLLRKYALICLYISAGLRTVEIRHAKVSNITVFEEGYWTIFLEVVKGIDSYGEQREVMLIDMFVPTIERYLRAREKYLEDSGLASEYIFFAMETGEILSDKTIGEMRRDIVSTMGVNLDGRKCRRTFGTILKKKKVPIEDISVQMGHSSTKTAEGYYARETCEGSIETIREMLESRK